jgi:hypothetical protein
VTKINPRKIDGPWADGRVLDLHSTGSEFLGYDEYGHEQFDTRRTEVGDLLYRLKYRTTRPRSMRLASSLRSSSAPGPSSST